MAVTAAPGNNFFCSARASFMAIMESEVVTELQPIQLRPLAAEPLVSILVSNYNYAGYIGESIQSALNQTYTNIELII